MNVVLIFSRSDGSEIMRKSFNEKRSSAVATKSHNAADQAKVNYPDLFSVKIMINDRILEELFFNKKNRSYSKF